MFSLNILAPLVVATLAAAQSTDIAAIEAHFQQSGISPSLLQTFSPEAVMDVKFGDLDITPGQNLTVPQVQPTPDITVTPANSSVQLSGQYTIAMVDADVVGSQESSVTRHWLVNGVTLENNKMSNASATAITAYAAPLPAAGSGSHRYVILLYSQPSSFSAPSDPAANSPVGKFDFNAYVKSANLGPLVAGNYIQVEQGAASVSPSATSSVVSSTLAAAASGAASGSGAQASQTNKPSGASGLKVGFVSTVLAMAGFIFSAAV